MAREEEKRRKEEIKKQIETMQKRQRCFNTTWGAIESIIYIVLAVIQMVLIVSQRQVINQYFSQIGTKVQLFNNDLRSIEFSNTKQLEYYLIEKLGLAIDRNGDLSHDDGASSRFWQSNLLLRYIKV